MFTLVNLESRVGSGMLKEFLFNTFCFLIEGEGTRWLKTYGRLKAIEALTEVGDQKIFFIVHV